MCTNTLLGWCPRLPSLTPPCSSYADVPYWSPTRLQDAGAHAEASIARQSWISIGRGWQATTNVSCSLLYFDHFVEYSAESRKNSTLHNTSYLQHATPFNTNNRNIKTKLWFSLQSRDKSTLLGTSCRSPLPTKNPVNSLSIVVAGQPYCLPYTKDHCVDQPTTQNSTCLHENPDYKHSGLLHSTPISLA